METEIQVISKYLVEKSQILFTKKKQVMSICTDRLLLQGLNTNIHTLADYEEIHYGSIKDIKASASNSNDFTVVADKKYDFSCEFRNRLICELKHEVSQYQECCDCDLFYCRLLYDIYNPNGDDNYLQRADIQVYESMIRVKIPINELRNEMSKVEKSAQRSNRFLIAQALIKRYKDIIFRRHDGHRGKDKYKNSDLSASQKYSRSGSAIQANPDELLSKKQSRRVSKKEERKSTNSSLENNPSKEDTENNSNEVEVTLDPFDNKDRMRNEELVPRLITFKSTFNESGDSEIIADKSGNYNKRHQRYQDDFCITYIYLTDIFQILVSETVLVLLKENFEVIKFIKDEEKSGDLFALAEICAENAKDMLRKKIEVCKVQTLTDETNKISLHFSKNSNITPAIYCEEAFYLDSFSNMRKVYLRVDRESIHILKKKSNGIFISAPIRMLKFVYIYDVLPLVKTHEKLCNLRLVFNCAENEIDLKLYFKKREELLSVIFTLRSIARDSVNEIRFLLNEFNNFREYFIVMPCTNTLDDYETTIIKELSLVMEENHLYDINLLQLLDETIMNCKFSNINKVDPLMIKQIVSFLPLVL